MIVLPNYSVRSFIHNIKADFSDIEKCNNFLETLNLEFRFKRKKSAIFHHENGYFIFYLPPLEEYSIANKPNYSINEIIEKIEFNGQIFIAIGRYTDKERFFRVKKNPNKPGCRFKRVVVRAQAENGKVSFRYVQFMKKRYSYSKFMELFDDDIGISKKSKKQNPTEKKILCVETNEEYSLSELKRSFSRFDYNRIIKVLNGEFETAMSYHWKYTD